MIVAANIICIYIMINNITGQMYIGQTDNFDRRMDEHFRGKDADRQWIDRACLKYGREAFMYKPLDVFDEYDKDVLDDAEEFYIAAYNTFEDRFHYNLTPGRDGFGAGEYHPFYRHDLDPYVLKEDWDEGLNLNQIAEKYNTNLVTVRQRLQSIGVDTSRRNKRDDLDSYVLKEDWDEGLSLRQIAEKYNTGSETVRQRLQSIGVDTSRGAPKNTTGFYRVRQKKQPTCKQGFIWVYQYRDNGKRKGISSVDLKKLEVKVKEKGLPWKKL